MFDIGFTGARRGMTPEQRCAIEALLAFAFGGPGSKFHHGDCVGADAEAAVIAKGLGFTLVAHPGVDYAGNQIYRQKLIKSDEYADPHPYLIRNQHIVDASKELYAAPSECFEKLRSGTWATIRSARRKRIFVSIIGPTGETI